MKLVQNLPPLEKGIIFVALIPLECRFPIIPQRMTIFGVMVGIMWARGMVDMQYWICPDCGSHMDPGERCNCRDEERGAVPLQQERPQVKSFAKRAPEIQYSGRRDYG